MVIINGVAYQGNNLSFRNGKVIIDGRDITVESKTIHISIDADINSLTVDHANQLLVTGNVGSLETVSGDVEVSGTVSGSVRTVSGDVACSNVGGSINTVSGSVKHRK